MFRGINIVLFALWYINTSFLVTNHVSFSLNKTDLSFKQSDSFNTITDPVSQHYTVSEQSLEKDKTYHIGLNQDYSAIKLTIKDTANILVYVTTDSDTLCFGEEVKDKNIDIPPSFAVFLKHTSFLNISSSKNTSIKLELFYAPQIENKQTLHLKKKKDGCAKPNTISQNNWRSGLPLPTPGRNKTNVTHCIIHHSAGNNNDTNYLNIVRNIYLFHTQSNGWDDIGYNFLIAPNGTIFSGRDPLGVDEEDNIQGAHYCGKNGSTMGICLLGNYNLTSPSLSILESLNALLSWKLYKENLSALDFFPHPNSTSDNLGVIAMHQDGCATQCPGDSAVLLLDSLKLAVETELNKCRGNVSIANPAIKFKQIIYPNPSTGRFYVMIEDGAQARKFIIKNQLGEKVSEALFPKNGLINVDLVSGYYFLELWNSDGIISTKKILIYKE